MRPLLGITLGDEEGVGPEITAAAIAHPSVRSIARTVIFGNPRILKMAFKLLSLDYDLPILQDRDDLRNFQGQSCVFFREGGGPPEEIKNLDAALEIAGDHIIAGFVTCPLSKEKVAKSIKGFSGHSGYLKERTGAKEILMTFIGRRLRVGLLTTHIPLSEVPSSIHIPGIMAGALLAEHYTKHLFGIKSPLLGLCALNPHAGEEGQMGGEEREILIPAVRRLKERGINLSGPLPSDTLFRLALQGRFDFVLSLYHDQGLIPLRMAEFGSAVHLTLGLPVMRASPDHGVARDIAWKGVATPDSMIESIRFLAGKYRAYYRATERLPDLALQEECDQEGIYDK